MVQLGTDDLQKQFESLEAGGDIDSELAAMKGQMLTASENPPTQQLPKSQDS